VHHALAAETPLPARVVGHVVAVRQEQEAQAAHFADAAHQGAGRAGRVHHHVAARAHDQVRRGAEGGLRREAAVVHAFGQAFGKRGHAFVGRAALGAADGRGGTRHQRHQRAPTLGLVARLAVDVREVVARGGEDLGGHDAAGRAVDTRAVHVELAGHVLGQARFQPGHAFIVRYVS
jgi:hypothetical protein